ncbi:uncharacterized protein [Apostichopus japonicus]|uniref:uncharacterized protein isoform X4 n=1 Tax=Stichopus japonicus TaxID=307972 RepID=UPI003AB6080F
MHEELMSYRILHSPYSLTNETNSVKEMSSESATREVQMPMKKRMNVRDCYEEDGKDKRDSERRDGLHVSEKPEMAQKNIPEQQRYLPNLGHPQGIPTSHIVVAPSAVMPNYAPRFTHGVVQPSIQTSIPHHLSLTTSIMDQRTLTPLEAQQRYPFNHYVPLELSTFGLVSRGPKRHEPSSIIGDHSSPLKKVKKQKRPKEGRLEIPQAPKGIQGSMPQASSAVQPIILNFDVPAPKVPKVRPLEERLPSEVKFGSLFLNRSKVSDGSSRPMGIAVQDHHVTSEQGQDRPDSQGAKACSSSQRFSSQSPLQSKPPPFVPKTSRGEEMADGQQDIGGGAVTKVSPFKVPNIDQYKASTTGSQLLSGSLPVLTCFICKNQIHPGSRDYPIAPSLIITCTVCKRIAFGKKESAQVSIPKFPAACNPRVAPSEEVSAIRRKTFWKCLINHHKTTKQLRKRGRIIPRVSLPRGPRSVSSSVSGSYPASPQPMSPMSTCTAPSPCTSLPPSPGSQMSMPGSPLSQLPSPSLSPHPCLQPPSITPEGQFSGSRPVNSPKISSSGNDLRKMSQADQTEEHLDVPKSGSRQFSPGSSDVTMSPDSISLPPGRENEDATVRALLSLSAASSSESRNKLQVPGDISVRRHSLPISYEQRFSPRDRPLASRLVDSTENDQKIIQDYLDRQDLKYLKERFNLDGGGHLLSEPCMDEKSQNLNEGKAQISPKNRTFMISGKYVEGLKSDKPYEAFCCSCVNEEMVLIKCPTRSCEFVCNSISGMQIHEESHQMNSHKKVNQIHSLTEMRDGNYEDGASRSSVETQSADTDVEAKSPSSVTHFPHSSGRREEETTPSKDPSKDHQAPPSPAPIVSTSSVIDLGTTAQHVTIPRPNPPMMIPSSARTTSNEPTSPLDLSGKKQLTVGYSRSPKENNHLAPPSFQLGGTPLDLSSQTKHGYSDIVSYQVHNREKEQFVSNPMLGSTGKVIERPPAPAPNMMPSIQIPLPTTAVSIPTQIPTLPFFYTPFIPYPPTIPVSMATGIPLTLMGPQNSTSSLSSAPPRFEKSQEEGDREPKLYQGPFAFLNQVHAARSRAAKAAAAAASSMTASPSPQAIITNHIIHPGTPSPTSSCSSGSWHREKLRETSPASRSLTCSPQRAMAQHTNSTSPHSVSYQGGTISIQSNPTMGGHRRISPKTVKIESPFHQQELSPFNQGEQSSSSSTECSVRVKIEHCSDDEGVLNNNSVRARPDEGSPSSYKGEGLGVQPENNHGNINRKDDYT